MRFRLRDYQEEALEMTRMYYDGGINRLLGFMATGMGKGVVAAFLPEQFPDLFERYGMLVLVPRREIGLQIRDNLFNLYGHRYSVGLEMGEYRARGDEHILIMSVATGGREDSTRIEKLARRHFGIVVSDEGHHATEGSLYDNILAWNGLGAGMNETLPCGQLPLSLLLTATPNRHDGRSLTPFVDEVAFSYDITYGVRNGWLTDIRAYQVRVKNEKSGVDPVRRMADTVVAAYDQFGLGLKMLVFNKTLAEAEESTNRFNDFGVPAAFISGETEKDERDRIITAHKRGDLRVITNVNVLTEGYDDRALDGLIVANTTQSKTKYIQMIGRALRPLADLTGHHTPAERKAAILASSKPYAHIIDLYDDTTNHTLCTVPKLFDLPEDFDCEGAPVFDEVMDFFDELETEELERPVEDARSISEIELALNAVDVWSQTIHNEELKNISPLRWIHDTDGSYSLYLPENPKATKPTDRTPRILRLEPDGKHGYTVVEVDVGGWVERHRGRGFAKRSSQKQVTTTKDPHAFMRQVDRGIVTSHPALYDRLRRDFVSPNAPATKKQVERLKKLGVRHGADLTRTTAELLYDHARIAEKMKKIGTHTNKELKSR